GNLDHGVAVGRRLHRHFDADRAAAALPVVHYHRLPERLAELLRQRARHDVGLAARRERDDQPDWLRRVLLLGVYAARDDQQSGHHTHQPIATHWHPPPKLFPGII